MWAALSDFIIRFRVALIAVILLITVFMGYHARRVEMSYDFARTVPPEDPDALYFAEFKKQFGEDGNMVAVGVLDSSVYTLEKFLKVRDLALRLKAVPGVNDVIALPRVKLIQKDTAQKKFYLADLFPDTLRTQQELDSLLNTFAGLKFYEGQLVNPANGAMLMLVAMNKEYLNSSRRIEVTNGLVAEGDRFEKETGVQVHYAGLPFVRSVVAFQVRKELVLFLYTSAIVTGIIMFLFFRSWRAVLFSMIIIAIVVVWVIGSIVLFGYKISLLSGLIPPVVVTIGITNCIYLLNKYHLEFARHRNKEEAIAVVVRKMGLATFLTNLTVAIGFLTLLSTDILVLREFGIIAGINILALFIVCLIMIPGVFSWLPPPSEKHLKHLSFPIMGKFLHSVDTLVTRRRPLLYVITAGIAVFSVIGIMRLHALTFMVDDIPEDSQVKQDLKFFEANFSGIMPLEIVLEFKTKRRRPVLDVNNLQKIDEFESFLDSITVVSRPISIASFVKAAKQAYYNNNPDRYALPSRSEGPFILNYMKGQSDNTGLFNSFVDTTFSRMRISSQMADIGSVKMDSLIRGVIEPRMAAIFAPTEPDTVISRVTGSTKLFLKGNSFLIASLTESLVLAFILITLSMALLFANARMIVISLIPNLIALMITAGFMGYLDIPLKPSTAIIFSITFGISVDNSIRFLAKYRQELFSNNFFIPISVTESILETGKSIIYTSIVLFAGFIIFAFSSFGGTISLGILTSTTLVISMFTNLILLPALILTFDKRGARGGTKGSLPIDNFESTFYGEGDDEEIDLSKIAIRNRHSAAE
jgi:hypothetical protein